MRKISMNILLEVTFYILWVRENYKSARTIFGQIILLKELKFIYGLPHARKKTLKYIKQ